MKIWRRVIVGGTAGALLASAALVWADESPADHDMRMAVTDGTLPSLEASLKAGANPNDAWDGTPVLIHAIQLKRLEFATFLLDHGAKTKAVSTEVYSPLLYAARYGYPVEYGKVILDHGADAGECDKFKMTPLMLLSSWGKLDAEWLKMLLDHHADLNARDAKGRTALMLAAMNGRLESARLLLDAGADVNAHDKDWNALMFAALSGKKDMAKLLAERGAETDDSLFDAASAGNLEAARRLVESGAKVGRRTSTYGNDPGSKTDYGSAAIDLAAAGDHRDVVVYLLGLKAVGKDSMALRLAASYGWIGTVKLLLDSGQYKNDADTLTDAAGNGQTDVVLLLIERGQSLWAAVQDACFSQQASLFEVLLARGAVPNQDCLDRFLVSSLGRADLAGANHFLKLGADPHAGLEYAATIGRKDFIDLLLAAGAEDRDGKAAGFACWNAAPKCPKDAIISALTNPLWPIPGDGLQNLLDDGEKKRLSAGVIRWTTLKYKRQPGPNDVDFDATGWENLSKGAARAIEADRAAFIGAARPAAPALSQNEYESRSQFEARVAEARSSYERAVREHDAKAAAYPPWRRNAILEAVLENVFETPTVAPERDYDPDSQTFTPTVVASSLGYGKGVRLGFALTEPVPTNRAAEFDAALKDSRPRVTFQLRGGSLSAVSAEFDVLGKTYTAIPVKVPGAGKDLARVELGSAAADPAPTDLHVSYADNPELAQKAAELEKLKNERAAKDQLKRLEAEISTLKKGEERSYHSDVDRPAFAARPARPDDLALVVGIESYQDAALPKASFAERDARAVAAHLQALGVPRENIKVLEGQAATAGKIRGYLESWLAKNAKPDSRVYFYFSGHGAPEPESGGAYLVSWDGDPQFLKTTAVPLANVYDDLGKLRVKQVLVAMDACFSGTGGRSVMKKGARPLVTHLHEENAASPNVTILAAAGSDEIAGSFEAQGHGIFTYYLLKGLDDGARDTDALCRYLKPKVSNQAARDSATQTPVCRGPELSF